MELCYYVPKPGGTGHTIVQAGLIPQHLLCERNLISHKQNTDAGHTCNYCTETFEKPAKKQVKVTKREVHEQN